MKRIACLAAASFLVAIPAAFAGPPEQPGPPEPVEAEDPYVVGGQPVAEGKWTDAAAVIFGSGGAGCTGVLVAPDVVLTAGHCIDGSISSVKLGVNDFRQAGETIAVTRQVEYPDPFRSYDIGVLVLAQPSSIPPRPLAVDCVSDDIVDGAEVAIVGYGATDANASQYGSELREAFTTITDADCSDLNKGCVASVSPGGELGAGGNGIDSCNGDSGGPLYLLTDRGEFLVGITSRAYDDATLPCSQGGIYVRPDAVIDWIETTTARKVTRPVCNLAPAPVALPIEVRAGESELVTIEAHDPDPTDTHTFEIATEPAHGVAELDLDGNVVYTADADYQGPDELVVRVVDSGEPSLSTDAVVAVTVLPNEGSCSCRTGTAGGSGWLVLVALGWLGIRRRLTT